MRRSGARFSGPHSDRHARHARLLFICLLQNSFGIASNDKDRILLDADTMMPYTSRVSRRPGTTRALRALMVPGPWEPLDVYGIIVYAFREVLS